MRNKILKNICWAMVFILFISWSGIPQNAAYAQKTARLNEEQRKSAIEKLEKLFDALEEAAKEIPRDTFDPQAIVDKVGKDPIKLFEWVRDNTYLVPYRGTLRGPIGVLMDRLGNSLDRALLLHELLHLAGHNARLAHGVLSERQAKEVLDKTKPVCTKCIVATKKSSREKFEEMIKKYTDTYQIDNAEMSRIVETMAIEQQHLAEEVSQRVAEQTPIIAEAAGVPDKKEQMAQLRIAAVEAFKDHWWVQWRHDSGWIDLDVSLPEAKQRNVLTEVQTNYRPDQLDERFFHLVTIRVVIERWTKGNLQEYDVLEHTLRPSELLGERILLHHMPLNFPKDFNLSEVENPITLLKTAVLNEEEWLPILTIGSKQFGKYSFTDTGVINDKLSKKAVSSDRGMGIGGLWGGVLGETADRVSQEKSKKDSHLTAEWIEYEIRVPGQPVRKIRRQVFDLQGPAARGQGNVLRPETMESRRLDRGLALIGETEILPLGCQLSEEFVYFLLMEKLLANKEVFMRVIEDRFDDASAEFLKVLPLISPLYVLALSRWELARFHNKIYLNCSNIFSFHYGLRNDSYKDLLYFLAVDIVSNDIVIRPGVDGDPFLVCLEQGVLDTNLEAMIMARGNRAQSTALIFTETTTQGMNWIAIKKRGDDHWKKLNIEADARNLIERDLDAGFVVVVPESTIKIGDRTLITWWSVDPKSGQTLGFSEYGWGSGMISYEFLHSVTKITEKVYAVFLGVVIFVFCRAGQKIGYWIETREPSELDLVKCGIAGVAMTLNVLGFTTLVKILLALLAGASLK